MFLFSFLKDFIYLFLERGEGREEKREKRRHERETSIRCFSCAPRTRDKPSNPGMGLPGDQTSNLPSFYRMTANQLSHTGQGQISSFSIFILA